MAWWNEGVQKVQNQIKNYEAMANWKPQTGSYLESSNLPFLASQGQWNDYMRQLGLNYLFNISDFNSPLYQQFAQFQRNTTPSIGVNTLLAPLIASGVNFGQAQGIAQQRASELQRERTDAIGNSVRNFALGLQNNILPTIGQIGQSFFTQQQLAQQDRQIDAQTSPFAQLGGLLGTGLGMYLTGGLGAGTAGAAGASGAAAAAAALPMVLKR